MVAEVFAFLYAFDAVLLLFHDHKPLLSTVLPLFMFIGSKQFYHALTPAKRTTEKRLMVDLSTALDEYKTFEISAMVLVHAD